MELGYILRRGWRITWDHKALWLFGFLVSAGVVSTPVGVLSFQWDLLAQELPPEAQRVVVDLLAAIRSPTAGAVLTVVGFLVGVGLMLLGSMGRTALVNQVRSVESYDVVVLRGGWLAGKRHIWRIFFARLLLGLPVVVVGLGSFAPILVARYLVADQGLGIWIVATLTVEAYLFVCLAPALCLAVLLSVLLGVLQRLAVRACVLEALGVRRGLARAWELLRGHAGWIALVWLMLTVIGVGVALLVGVPAMLVVALLLVVSWLVVFLSPPVSVALTLVLALLTWLAAVAVAGVLEAFSSTVWTLAYREMTGMGLTGEEAWEIGAPEAEGSAGEA